jgi:hypothetical protein
MERCRREIAAIEAELRAGNPDVTGLFLAFADWHAELRILENEYMKAGHAERPTKNYEPGKRNGHD